MKINTIIYIKQLLQREVQEAEERYKAALALLEETKNNICDTCSGSCRYCKNAMITDLRKARDSANDEKNLVSDLLEDFECQEWHC